MPRYVTRQPSKILSPIDSYVLSVGSCIVGEGARVTLRPHAGEPGKLENAHP
jgi:hypothetical protein